MNRLWQTLREDLRPDTERGSMVRSATAAMAIRAGSLGIAFLASLLYARVLGPSAYGAYAYVIAWSAVLTIPASLGYPQYLVREGARQQGAQKWLLHWATRGVIPSGLAAACILLAIATLTGRGTETWLFVAAAPLPLLNNLGDIRSALLQVRGRIAASQWPRQLLGPALMLAIMTAFWMVRGHLLPLELIVIMALTALIVVVVLQTLLGRTMHGMHAGTRGNVRTRHALSFMWLGMLYLLNGRIDLIMLGAIDGTRAAGIYAIASRIAELVPFVLMASNTVIGPRIARAHQDGDSRKLQRLLTASSRRVLLATLPIAVAFLVFAQPFLRGLYGNAFAGGAIVLQLLTLAQMFNVFAGPTGLLLNMTGNERMTTIGVGVSVVVNVVLNAVLIPDFGAIGAACATGTSMVVWNILLWYWIRRRLSLKPSAIGA